MVPEPDNLILVYLRRFDERLDRIDDTLREIKMSLTSLETSVALVHGDFAGQSGRIDRLENRLECIEQPRPSRRLIVCCSPTQRVRFTI